MTLALVDTSVWIAFFRGDRTAVKRVDPLLADGAVAVCGPTFAELISGAPTAIEMRRLRILLGGLEWLEPDALIWERIAQARFALARVGIQAAVLDLFIALTAVDRGAVLLTRDRDFEHIRTVVPIQLVLF